MKYSPMLAVTGKLLASPPNNLLSLNNTNWTKEIFIQISESQVARAIRTKRWKLCVDDPKADLQEAITLWWKPEIRFMMKMFVDSLSKKKEVKKA